MLTRMAAPTTLSLSYPEPDIAVITIGDPETSANILSRHVLDALEQHLDELDPRKKSGRPRDSLGKPGMFIAGADLKEFVTGSMHRRRKLRSFLPPRAAALRPVREVAAMSRSRRSMAFASAAARSSPCGAIGES